MKWFGPRNWNDMLSVPLVIGMPVLLTLVYFANIPLPEIVVGAFIGGWTLGVQYYYRRAPETSGEKE